MNLVQPRIKKRFSHFDFHTYHLINKNYNHYIIFVKQKQSPLKGVNAMPKLIVTSRYLKKGAVKMVQCQ